MSDYDKHYQTENLFGQALPELIDYLSVIKSKGKLLDLGCGQGRNALPLAKLGFVVTGVDLSKVGINQMNQIARRENLPLEGIVGDIFAFDALDSFEVILLDSMFHFAKKDKARETAFLHRIFMKASRGCLIIICIQDTGTKVAHLQSIIDSHPSLKLQVLQSLEYKFEDQTSDHISITPYKMLVLEKAMV